MNTFLKKIVSVHWRNAVEGKAIDPEVPFHNGTHRILLEIISMNQDQREKRCELASTVFEYIYSNNARASFLVWLRNESQTFEDKQKIIEVLKGLKMLIVNEFYPNKHKEEIECWAYKGFFVNMSGVNGSKKYVPISFNEKTVLKIIRALSALPQEDVFQVVVGQTVQLWERLSEKLKGKSRDIMRLALIEKILRGLIFCHPDSTPENEQLAQKDIPELKNEEARNSIFSLIDLSLVFFPEHRFSKILDLVYKVPVEKIHEIWPRFLFKEKEDKPDTFSVFEEIVANVCKNAEDFPG